MATNKERTSSAAMRKLLLQSASKKEQEIQQIGSVGGTVARMAEEDDGLVRGVGVLQRVFGDDRERDQPGTRHELLGILVGFADVDKPGFALGKTLESFLRGYGWKHGDSFAASA